MALVSGRRSVHGPCYPDMGPSMTDDQFAELLATIKEVRDELARSNATLDALVVEIAREIGEQAKERRARLLEDK